MTNARASPKPRCAADECQHEHELAHAAWTEKTRLEKTVACQKRWEKKLRGGLRGLPKQARRPSYISKRDQVSLVDKNGRRRTVTFSYWPS